MLANGALKSSLSGVPQSVESKEHNRCENFRRGGLRAISKAWQYLVPKSSNAREVRKMKVIKIVAIAMILGVGIYVAVSPSLVYAPTPRIVLFFLVSFLPGLLLGAEAASRFEMRLPGFAFTTAGACAVCFGALFLLAYLSQPEEKIAVFQVYDERNNPVLLDWSGALEVPVTSQGLTVTRFVEGNNLILVFPEQVGSVELRIKKALSGSTYSGTVGYSGSRTSKLMLGAQLKTPNN